MGMLSRIGGLSKMTDNHTVANSVRSLDESLPALLSATVPMARSAASTRFSEALGYAVCCAAAFCEMPIVVASGVFVAEV